MNKGKLIVIEGALDGIGKSTQADLLYKELSKDNRVITHHFPSYDTDQGKLASNYLNGEYGTMYELNPYFVNTLYAVDRMITWKKDLEKEYNNGSIILLDRYTISSLIYQSCLIDNEDEKKKFINYVIDYEYNKLGIKEPDMVIFLNAPYDLIKTLRKERNKGSKEDIHEQDDSFMKKVYENANYIANYLNFNIINCENEDKTNFRSIEDIHNDIINLIKKV